MVPVIVTLAGAKHSAGLRPGKCAHGAGGPHALLPVGTLSPAVLHTPVDVVLPVPVPACACACACACAGACACLWNSLTCMWCGVCCCPCCCCCCLLLFVVVCCCPCCCCCCLLLFVVVVVGGGDDDGGGGLTDFHLCFHFCTCRPKDGLFHGYRQPGEQQRPRFTAGVWLHGRRRKAECHAVSLPLPIGM